MPNNRIYIKYHNSQLDLKLKIHSEASANECIELNQSTATIIWQSFNFEINKFRVLKLACSTANSMSWLPVFSYTIKHKSRNPFG